MRELTNKELNQVVGGGGLSGAVISSIIRGINLVLELGRSFGSSIRRFVTKKYC